MTVLAVFEVGSTYQHRSLVDHEWITRYKVVSRTPSFVTLLEEGCDKPIRRKVKTFDRGDEFLFPDGVYSLCPTLRAESKVDPPPAD